MEHHSFPFLKLYQASYQPQTETSRQGDGHGRTTIDSGHIGDTAAECQNRKSADGALSA